jgi:predicted nucleic acid-binding protein
MPTMEALTAATALAFNQMLATRNVADFENAGGSLINPWEE